MTDTQYDFKIIKDHDVDSLKKDFDKVDSMKLDLKNNRLSKHKFLELFERLSAIKLHYFQLDISNWEGMDNEKFEALVMCLRQWNPKTLILLVSGIKFSDSQFESLFHESLRTMSNLENLYLDMENINFTPNKAKSLENLIPKMDNLNNIFLNLRNNKLNKEDTAGISKSVQNLASRELLF